MELPLINSNLYDMKTVCKQRLRFIHSMWKIPVTVVFPVKGTFIPGWPENHSTNYTTKIFTKHTVNWMQQGALCPLFPSADFNWFRKTEHIDVDKMVAVYNGSFTFLFSCKKLPGIQLTIIQHCFRYWLVAEQATRHHLNKWWSSLQMC